MSLALPVYPLAPAHLPLQAAAQRLWMIRRLWRERALDDLAADTALRRLRYHPNERLAALATQTSREIVDRFIARQRT
jgi:hypothetical protein